MVFAKAWIFCKTELMIIPPMLEQIFQVIPDIVFCIKDRNRIYRVVNLAFVERLGVKSEGDIIGKNAEDLFLPDLAATYHMQDSLILEQGEEMIDRLELVTNRDGSLGWYIASKFPLRDEEEEICGIISISRDLHAPSERNLQMAGLRKVVDWVHEHIEEEIHTEDLAKLASMSVSQLERRMKRVFKLGVAQFVRKIRVGEAARRLLHTDQPIAEIALSVGYSEQSSFSRQFKTAVGMPPGEYRRKDGNRKKSTEI